MDIVAHAGTVLGGIVVAVDFDEGADAERDLGGDLDEQRRFRGGLAVAAAGIGAGHVEIAQRHVFEVAHRGDVAQHHLGHQLGRAIGRDRCKRRRLGNRIHRGIAVDRGRRREDEVPDAEVLHGRQEGAALDRIGVIVFERVVVVLRSDQPRREMDDRVHLVALDRTRDRFVVAAVAQHERHAVRDRPWHAVRHVVDDDGLLAGIDEPEDHVSADIARAARHQHRHSIPLRPDCAPGRRHRTEAVDPTLARRHAIRSPAMRDCGSMPPSVSPAPRCRRQLALWCRGANGRARRPIRADRGGFRARAMVVPNGPA